MRCFANSVQLDKPLLGTMREVRSLRHAIFGHRPESFQYRDTYRINPGKQRGANQKPGDDGVEDRFEKGSDGTPEILLEKRTQLLNRKRRRIPLEDECAKTHKRDQQENLQWVYQIVEQLNSRLVESQHDGDGGTDQGRRTQNREHPDHRAEGDAQRQPFRRDALLEQVQDRLADFIMEETFYHFYSAVLGESVIKATACCGHRQLTCTVINGRLPRRFLTSAETPASSDADASAHLADIPPKPSDP